VRSIAILGSTGSVGRQALDVVAEHPDRFRICGLAARSNVELLAAQAKRFHPRVISCGTAEGLATLKGLSGDVDGSGKRLEHGATGLRAVAAESGADVVLAATDGLVACDAVFAAVSSGIHVALANKEIAVAAGEPMFALARTSSARILPVDSEHSAVFQCLAGERRDDVRSIVLTASGGPFWNLSAFELSSVTPDQALVHPTWMMGKKNSLDSATLMNKGLEVIEACRFFDLSLEQIEVVVHRQSFAHAFVFFSDGSVKAQLAWPDMRLPIGFALSYPDRLRNDAPPAQTRAAIGLAGTQSSLTFEPVDEARFPCLRLAYRAAEHGGTFPAVLSASNEEAGRAFLQGKIKFTDIGALVAAALDAHSGQSPTLPSIEGADRWARSFTRDAILEKPHTTHTKG
jgi:1-deoxy-D-xylulose-5-phosphate reductoisomerase